MREKYESINADTKYLNYKVDSHAPTLVVERAGSACSTVTLSPLSNEGGTAKFHIAEPCFGMPDGWYNAYLMDDCDVCMSMTFKISNECKAIFTDKEQAIFSVEDCEKGN